MNLRAASCRGISKLKIQRYKEFSNIKTTSDNITIFNFHLLGTQIFDNAIPKQILAYNLQLTEASKKIKEVPQYIIG